MENKENNGIFVRVYNWFKNLTVKGLLGAIFIVFVIIVLLMSVSYLPSVLSRISSSFSAALYSVFVPAEGATMSADKKIINSGEDFTVTFRPGDTKDGIFTIYYSCDQNLSLRSVEGSVLKNIDCDTPFYLLNNNNSIKIRAVSDSESVVRLALTGALENNETLKSETVGIVRVTVKNDSLGTVVTDTPRVVATTSISNNTYTPPTNTYVPAPIYYGRADLAVRVLQVGRLNTATNMITNQTSFSNNDTVGIRFEVRNDGDAATSGYWNFTAILPSISTPIYTSPTQVSLRPGESIQFTLGFNNLTNQRTGLISINVDPSNLITESNEGNNLITSSITNTGYNSNNYNNNYNNGCYVNGYFSYNCSDYNYNNYGDMSVSCYATPSYPDTGDTVHWYANVYGGDGDYTYDWTGTNNLNTSSHNPTKTYSSNGIKYATVTVEDGNGDTATQTCSVDVGGNGSGWNGNNNVDLAVEIIAVGRVNSSGSFIEDGTISEGDNAAIKFRVTNEGDEESERWDYDVDLTPSFSGDTYSRTNMASLSPGQTTTVTVRFNDISDTGTNRFRVEIDPNDDIGDDYRSNNTDTETIRVN